MSYILDSVLSWLVIWANIKSPGFVFAPTRPSPDMQASQQVRIQSD